MKQVKHFTGCFTGKNTRKVIVMYLFHLNDFKQIIKVSVYWSWNEALTLHSEMSNLTWQEDSGVFIGPKVWTLKQTSAKPRRTRPAWINFMICSESTWWKQDAQILKTSCLGSCLLEKQNRTKNCNKYIHTSSGMKILSWRMITTTNSSLNRQIQSVGNKQD